MDVASIVRLMATVAWLLFFAVIVVAVVRASRGRPVKGFTTIIIVLGVSALLLSIAGAGLVFIQPEDRGVVISAVSPQGYRSNALEPGLHWIIPFFESVVTYPISKQTYTMSISPNEGSVTGDDSITARTADGQEIFVDASVIFALDPAEVVKVHIAWQNRYANDLVRPLSRGVIRDVVSQYRVEEVVTSKRVEMTDQISNGIEQKLADNGLLMSNFIVRNITFSPEYAASVEQKQIAEQQAQQAKLVVEQRRQEAEQARQQAQGVADSVVIRAKGDAQSRLIQAEAEAGALDLIAKALQDKPELLTYQYITKLSPNIQAMLLPSNQPFLFPLPTVGAPALSAQPVPTAVPTAVPTTTP
jgi:regulator of protease activity HflC (stomatin/prohibitin superfamily)